MEFGGFVWYNYVLGGCNVFYMDGYVWFVCYFDMKHFVTAGNA